MNILLIEDNKFKADKIKALISTSFAGYTGLKLFEASSSSSGKKYLRSVSSLDVLILDLNIPRIDNENPVDGEGTNLLSDIQADESFAMPDKVICLSHYDSEIEKVKSVFDGFDFLFVKYDPSSIEWENKLDNSFKRHIRFKDTFNRSKDSFDYDIGVLVALDSPESKPFFEIFDELNEYSDPSSASVFYTGSFTWMGKKFKVVLGICHEMGNSASAILASKMLGTFKPRFLAMSGICGGVESEVKLGNLIIAEITFDYYHGKRYGVPKDFQPAPRQCKIPPFVRRDINFFLSQSYDFSKYTTKKDGLDLSPGFFVVGSGSSVLADAEFLKNVKESANRKLSAVDMEIYGFYSACEQSDLKGVHYFAAKSVCDFADSSKNDDYQYDCSRYSAFFIAQYIRYLIEKKKVFY